MNFKERLNVNPTVKVRSTVHPIVYIAEKALNKMFLFTKEITTEVGWLGTVKRNENQFLIDDVFLLKQEVHATTTEITSEGLTTFAEELLASPNGFDLWNDMKMWGHSHVNMPISPSGQDNQQMEVFSNSGHDFFIRLICNKKGDLSVDVYDFEKGIEYHNCKWKTYEQPANEYEASLIAMREELEKKYQELEEEIKSMKEEKVKSLEIGLKEEIKEKVKSFPAKTYASNRNYVSYGGYKTSAWDDYIDQQTTVAHLFTEKELYELAKLATTAGAMHSVLNECYPEMNFTFNDAYKIFAYTQKYKKHVGGIINE